MANNEKTTNEEQIDIITQKVRIKLRKWLWVVFVSTVTILVFINIIFRGWIKSTIEEKINKYTIEQVTKNLMESEDFAKMIKDGLAKGVLPEMVKSELKPYLTQLSRLPKENKPFTYSGVVTVDRECPIEPPWGTTDDWDIIVLPLAPGYRNLQPKEHIDTSFSEPEMEDIRGSLNDYQCYVVRVNSKKWKIVGSQLLEVMWSPKGRRPIDVFFLMISKLQPRS